MKTNRDILKRVCEYVSLKQLRELDPSLYVLCSRRFLLAILPTVWGQEVETYEDQVNLAKSKNLKSFADFAKLFSNEANLVRRLGKIKQFNQDIRNG